MFNWASFSRPLDPEQVEYRYWLATIERRAILPIKWLILTASLFLWFLGEAGAMDMMPWPAFGLFFSYAMLNCGFTYFFLWGKPAPQQIKPLCLASFLCDLIFVTMLVYLDSVRISLDIVLENAAPKYSEFFVLYFVLIFRGFALFEGRRDGIILSLLIIGNFGFSTWLTRQDFSFLAESDFVLPIFLMWMMILVAWFIVDVIRSQQAMLQRFHENLARSESLAMVGEMASGVAHEVNNPIGIISAYAENMLRNSDPDDKRREDLEIMAQESQRCKAIIGELLNFARAPKQMSEMVDMRQVNDDVLKFVFHDHSKSHIVVDKHYENIEVIRADPTQLKQALVNIYLNARQAMKDKGEIKVNIHHHPERAHEILIQIVDNGPGMSKEDMTHAFEPFYTRKERGTGLGLSITKRIIDAQGGSISLHQLNGNSDGTRVEITLPCNS